MLPKLKRTLAVTWLLATACFVILWMRSASYYDSISYSGSSLGIFQVASLDGGLTVSRSIEFNFPEDQAGFFLMTKRSWQNDWRTHLGLPAWKSTHFSEVAFMPYWFLILVNCGIVCLLVDKPFRFGLRTVAIATTLIVLTLGLGVAASRLTLG